MFLRHHFAFYHRHICFEYQPFLAAIDLDGLSFVELAGKDLERQRSCKSTNMACVDKNLY